MENVPNILAMRNGRYRHQIVNAFRAAGYERTAVVTLTAADFGVPQERHRVFFIGLCDSLPFEGTVDQACARLFAVRMSDSRITVRQAISESPEGDCRSDDGPFPTPGGDPPTPNTRRLCASTSIPRYSANKSRRRNSRMGWRCTIIIPRGSKTGGDGSSKQSGRAAVAIFASRIMERHKSAQVAPPRSEAAVVHHPCSDASRSL